MLGSNPDPPSRPASGWAPQQPPRFGRYRGGGVAVEAAELTPPCQTSPWEFFSKTPHACVTNDQCDKGIILRYICWGTWHPSQQPPAPALGSPSPMGKFKATFSSGLSGNRIACVMRAILVAEYLLLHDPHNAQKVWGWGGVGWGVVRIWA